MNFSMQFLLSPSFLLHACIISLLYDLKLVVYASVVCGPYYLPQSDLGFSPQYPKVLLPGGFKRRPRAENMNKIKAYACTGYEPAALSPEYNNIMIHSTDRNQVTINNNSNQETLPLFPLHPTGILQGRETTMRSQNSSSADNSITTPSISSETTTAIEEGSGDKPFFNFFSGHDPFESD